MPAAMAAAGDAPEEPPEPSIRGPASDGAAEVGSEAGVGDCERTSTASEGLARSPPKTVAATLALAKEEEEEGDVPSDRDAVGCSEEAACEDTNGAVTEGEVEPEESVLKAEANCEGVVVLDDETLAVDEDEGPRVSELEEFGKTLAEERDVTAVTSESEGVIDCIIWLAE